MATTLLIIAYNKIFNHKVFLLAFILILISYFVDNMTNLKQIVKNCVLVFSKSMLQLINSVIFSTTFLICEKIIKLFFSLFPITTP